MEEKIKFQIETEKVLKLLSSEIYDSPYALLRENVQNAYDAILMRQQKEPNFTPKIEISLTGQNVTISDNGIGMSKDTVKNNYWKAGSSGKNNEEAKKAGVVGTFGIGAMANFGICKHLQLNTHYWGGNITVISEADKSTLSVTEDCISIKEQEEECDSGTTIYATLDDNCNLDVQSAIQYLQPYIQYLSIPVYFNENIISQKSYFKTEQNANTIDLTKNVASNGMSFSMNIQIQNYSNGLMNIYVNGLSDGTNSIKGNIYLEQGKNLIYGLRNNFGLAAIPVNSIFNFGGIINLSVLQPTAGREALSRESISFISNIINIVEKNAAEELAKHEIADSNRFFLSYIYNKGRYDLARKIKIQLRPAITQITFDRVDKKIDGKDVYYYTGSDSQIIEQYANENTSLLILSQENPRRSIQQKVLLQKQINQIPDKPNILKEYSTNEIDSAEFALSLRIMSTLKEDYLIGESKVIFADISHKVPNMVVEKNNIVIIYLSKSSGNILQVLKIYKEDSRLFDGFVKDFVRNHLYPKLAPFVPSSTRQGADALYRILQKNKELYTIEYDEMGDIETLMKEYVEGKKDLKEILKISSNYQNSQRQTVNQNQVGTVEQELSTVIQRTLPQDNTIVLDDSIAAPPIKITSDTTKKILKTGIQYPQLNNYTFFLALSDKIFDRQLNFFLEPHTTKVIWGMHKIVYIFTHASTHLTLYYDIELKNKLQDTQTGGKGLPTTTIISKNRLFVPIIPELISYFDVHQQLSFFVRFDLIIDSNERVTNNE
ncbi:MAG: ATP-binding protein [Bacteroidales bacterium]|jgi:molecular chaperone HtpG|nr:ATP-binding protein [Bacteroidales bacterium]